MDSFIFLWSINNYSFPRAETVINKDLSASDTVSTAEVLKL
jgi:hypothetical protein